MFSRFWQWLTQRKPTVQPLPKVNPPAKVIALPVKGGLPLVNRGSTKHPDFQYLASICQLDSHRVSEVAGVYSRITKRWADFANVERVTGVPAVLVAALAYREDTSLSTKACLHNGEYIIGTGRKTKLVPSGRGPFATWAEAAGDALMMKQKLFPSLWTTATMLEFAEKFNGLGYRNKGEYSPYVWAGTNISDETGKYIKDGKYSSSAIEKQLGVATIIIYHNAQQRGANVSSKTA